MFAKATACSAILLCWSLNQLPGHPAWSVMISHSALIVFGTVESESWVVRPDRMVVTPRPQPDGTIIAELPDIKDFMVGRIRHIRVAEVIKRERGVRAGGIVDVFLPGLMMTDQPLLIEGRKYILFLAPLQPDDDRGQGFEGTVLHKPHEPIDKDAKFDPERAYNIVWNGCVRISSDNAGVIDEVKAAMLQTPRVQ